MTEKSEFFNRLHAQEKMLSLIIVAW